MPRIILLTVCMLTAFFSYAQNELVKDLDSLQVIASNLESNDDLELTSNNNDTTDSADTNEKEIKTENYKLIKGLVSKPEKVAKFLSLSLVDKEFYSDFEAGVELLKESYKNQEVLITVATDFSEQRVFFTSEFYTQMNTGKTEYEAYENALILTRRVFPILDFKFYYLNPQN